jgi:hypothetical protein
MRHGREARKPAFRGETLGCCQPARYGPALAQEDDVPGEHDINRPHSSWPALQGPVAVVQPLPGIGDMVWHLPHIRAIAAYARQPVTLLTKPRSKADQLMLNDACVSKIVWLDLNPP